MIKAAVAIPVYKRDLSASEIASFKRCLHILGNHPLILVAPANLDLSAYHKHAGKELNTVTFNERFFKSVKGYSELLLHRSFYTQFIAYDYILIYQLDAWVFRDELLKWCKRDFDYIGAPWLDAPPVKKRKALINLGHLLKNKVGNGGVSLRKVRTHLRWAWWVSFIFKLFPKNEDMIWSLFVPFKKPGTVEALHFAFELEPRKSYQITGKTLPFTCHAWEKYDPLFWQSFIRSQ